MAWPLLSHCHVTCWLHFWPAVQGWIDQSIAPQILRNKKAKTIVGFFFTFWPWALLRLGGGPCQILRKWKRIRRRDRNGQWAISPWSRKLAVYPFAMKKYRLRKLWSDVATVKFFPGSAFSTWFHVIACGWRSLLVYNCRVHKTEESLLTSTSGFENYRGIVNLSLILLVRLRKRRLRRIFRSNPWEADYVCRIFFLSVLWLVIWGLTLGWQIF